MLPCDPFGYMSEVLQRQDAPKLHRSVPPTERRPPRPTEMVLERAKKMIEGMEVLETRHNIPFTKHTVTQLNEATGWKLLTLNRDFKKQTTSIFRAPDDTKIGKGISAIHIKKRLGLPL